MDSISVHVGKKIKFFRKLKKLSLDQLSAMIHKSKSTLSKYENGNISIDIETLLDIAKVLDIDLNHLIDYKMEKAQPTKFLNPFGLHNELYIYYYDGRKRCVVKSLLTLSAQQNKGSSECMFFMDIPAFDRYEKCQFFYIGEMNAFDLVTYLTLTNQANPMERLGFCILNPFHYNTTTWGFMFGISYNPIAPFALKFLLSTKPLTEDEITLERLSITSNEIKIMKNLNMMLLSGDK